MSHWGPVAAGVVVVLLLLVSLPFIYRTATIVGWENVHAIRRSRRAIQKIVRKRLPKARVHTMGITHLSPSNLCICIDVATDAERDALVKDTALLGEMRRALFKADYPEDVIPDVAFSVESQETVTRDFAGSWSKARQ